MLFLRVSVDFNAYAVRTWQVTKAPNSGVRKTAAFCDRDFSICMDGYNSESSKRQLSPSFPGADICYELRFFLVHFDTYFLSCLFCIQHLLALQNMSFVPFPRCPHPQNISADLCIKTALTARISEQPRICYIPAHQYYLFQSFSANKGFYGIAGGLLSVQEAKSRTV